MDLSKVYRMKSPSPFKRNDYFVEHIIKEPFLKIKIVNFSSFFLHYGQNRKDFTIFIVLVGQKLMALFSAPITYSPEVVSLTERPI